MKRFPKNKICPLCGSDLEPDEEYIQSQWSDEMFQIKPKDYPWFCPNGGCEKVFSWDEYKGWIEI